MQIVARLFISWDRQIYGGFRFFIWFVELLFLIKQIWLNNKVQGKEREKAAQKISFGLFMFNSRQEWNQIWVNQEWQAEANNELDNRDKL